MSDDTALKIATGVRDLLGGPYASKEIVQKYVAAALKEFQIAARSAALEEAAKVAEAHKPPHLSDWEDRWNWSDSRDAIAAAIRELKDK